MNAAPDGAAPERDSSTEGSSTRSRRRINVGLGRLLIFVYGLFALSAGARALVQLATKFHEAPLAYVLSAIAALIYIVATVCLARSTVRSRRLGIVCVSIELVGVVVVGSLSLSDKSAFPDATVWSGFGSGYGYVPLVLPILGLWWLLRGAQPATADATAADPANSIAADPGNR
jgi:hypothetical protein